jgi:hypothetical protein
MPSLHLEPLEVKLTLLQEGTSVKAQQDAKISSKQPGGLAVIIRLNNTVAETIYLLA